MIAELRQAAQTEVDNHSIYVWGGSGELCCKITEAWIRTKEAKCENGKYADAAVEAWKKVMASPYANVARCFDCSGFVSWCLNKAGAFRGRTNCDGLFARCEEVYTPTDGTLLFRVNPKKPNDETHVGIYIDGKQYEAKGRAYGVVCLSFKASNWQKYGWFKALKPDPKPDPPKPEPTGQVVKVVGKSVWVRNADSTKSKKLFVAHKGDTFKLLEVAPSGWYRIETKYPKSYITNKERYTNVE